MFSGNKLTPSNLELLAYARRLDDRMVALSGHLDAKIDHDRREFNERFYSAKDRANEKIHKLLERIHGLESRLESLEKFPPQID